MLQYRRFDMKAHWSPFGNIPTMRGTTDVLYLLTRAERLLSRRLAVILDAERCSMDAWRVVAVLADGQGHFMTELSELSFLPPGSLTRLIDHLVEENLVYRRGDDLDRRRIRVHLSARGRRLHDRVDHEIRQSIAGLPIGDELLDRLGDLITALDPEVVPVSILQRGKALT
jgi:DNA-binding MarR family transcriptional regulator